MSISLYDWSRFTMRTNMQRQEQENCPAIVTATEQFELEE
jgi:hypothetical protein